MEGAFKSERYENTIEVHWEYNTPNRNTILDIVRDLPDREFKSLKAGKFWVVPMSPFHCQSIIDTLTGYIPISPEVLGCTETKKKFTPSGRLDSRLYDYQKESVRWLASNGGRGLIGHDPGLGKTPISLVYLKSQLHNINRILIVSPAVATYKWQAEVVDWMKLDIEDVQVLSSGKVKIEDVKVTVTSYALASIRYKELRDRYDAVILDEAHYVKTPSVKRTASALQYCFMAKYLILLTGTPFMNRPFELWQLLNLIDGVSWPDRWKYAIQYCGAQKNSFGGMTTDGRSNVPELRKRLKNFMLRFTKREVKSELPSITIENIPVKARYKFKGEGGETPLVAIGREYREIGEVKAKVAYKWIEEFMNDYPDKKLVVYCHHRNTVVYLEDKISTKFGDRSVSHIIGGMGHKKSHQVATDFQNNKKPSVLLITSAASEAIDLYRAHHILFVEREWSPMKENQIIGRLDRVGQTLPVTAHKFQLLGSIDDHFVRLLDEKSEHFESIMRADNHQRIISSIIISERGE